jgi:hypothetical protein
MIARLIPLGNQNANPLHDSLTPSAVWYTTLAFGASYRLDRSSARSSVARLEIVALEVASVAAAGHTPRQAMEVRTERLGEAA